VRVRCAAPIERHRLAYAFQHLRAAVFDQEHARDESLRRDGRTAAHQLWVEVNANGSIRRMVSALRKMHFHPLQTRYYLKVRLLALYGAGNQIGQSDIVMLGIVMEENELPRVGERGELNCAT
jgi:hypothetical protein